MGKKTAKNTNLGRALIKDRFGKKARITTKDPSLLHTAELADTNDSGRVDNLKSVTEESSFQEFLSQAELAGTEFVAEKRNITFIAKNSHLPSQDEVVRILDLQNKLKDNIVIPRRPHWDEKTTPEELHANERKAFLEWRRNLSLLQETHDLHLTPYEKNIEFWRQLWRVLDRSDIVVQIVDARNPLIFHCKDLENYTLELNSSKTSLLLLNKADLLTHEQRVIWANYFDTQGIKAAFFTAIQDLSNDDSEVSQMASLSLTDNPSPQTSTNESEESVSNITSELNIDNPRAQTSTNESEESVSNNTSEINIDAEKKAYKNNPNLLSRSELISLLKSLKSKKPLTVGLVGYPNVGKSSTINALMTEKKVSVSAQPGKTKHFQTLFLESDFILCDCPGLVMPSFAISKADMVISGILSIDHIKDHVPSVALLLSLMPRSVLEALYGIMLPKPAENEDPLRPPTPEEFLNAFAYIRGFMTQNGQPDNARAARLFLKDFVTGRIIHVHAPPGVNQEDFHKHSVPQGKKIAEQSAPARRALKSNIITSEEVDKAFFQKNISEVHVKSNSAIPSSSNTSKPWKDHKAKRNKREKLRRIYSHLDQ